MSSVRAIDQTPIENKAQLIRHFEEGCKPKSGFLIGTEHEKFVLDAKTYAPIPYAGDRGIKALLEGMGQRFGYEPLMEGEYIIGLTRERESVSLEPAGQLELSGAPLVTLHEMSDELDKHMAEALEIGRELGLCYLPIGYHPTARLADMPWMPKGRYAIMREYMPKVGTRGLEMMQLCCTTQVNLDYLSEADMARKMRVSLALQPIVSALFAYSPFREGKQSGGTSNRCGVWLDVDNARSGIPTFAFSDGFGFERYVDYALDVPMYFVMRDNKFVNCAGQSFRAFMEGKLPALPGEKPTMTDWMDHLTTLFPDVRLKTYLEMRGADVGPVSMIKALPTLWVGLLYDDTSLGYCESMIQEWGMESIQVLRREVPRLGMSAIIHNRNVFSIAKQLVTWSVQGLRRRAYRAPEGPDETRYLEHLLTIVDIEQTEAERLLYAFNGAWDEKIEPLFKELCLT
jgi:glutamate--cysteine ligase